MCVLLLLLFIIGTIRDSYTDTWWQYTVISTTTYTQRNRQTDIQTETRDNRQANSVLTVRHSDTQTIFVHSLID